MTRLLSQGYKVNRLSNTFKKFCAETLTQLDNTGKMSAKCLLILSVEIIFIFDRFDDAKLIKLAEMAGVMHEADHTCSIWSTW